MTQKKKNLCILREIAYRKEDMMRYLKISCYILAVASSCLFVQSRGYAAEKDMVTVHRDRALVYGDEQLTISEPVANGTVYDVEKTLTIDHVPYYKVSRGKDVGYIAKEDVETLKVTSTQEKTWTTKANQNIWKNLFFTDKKANSKDNILYYSDKEYTLGNGKVYTSIYTKDKKQHSSWQGYIAKSSLIQTNGEVENKRVMVEEDADCFDSLETYHPMTRAYKGQVYQVKRRYEWSGNTYYSIYRTNGEGKEQWMGYINASHVREVNRDSVESQYYDFKSFDETKGYITTDQPLTIYNHPFLNAKHHTKKFKVDTLVTYDAEAFNALGNYVRVSLVEKGKEKRLGWLDKRYISLLHPVRKVADKKQKDMPVWDAPWHEGAKQIATMADFLYGNIECVQTYRSKEGTEYSHLIVDGGEAGWVDSEFVERNTIDVADNINLVRSYKGKAYWNPIDAVNYATSSQGTYLDPVKDVKANLSTIDTSKPGVYPVTYYVGTVHKTVNVTVRDKENEGVVKASTTSTPTKGYPKVPYIDDDTILNYSLSEYKQGKAQYGKSDGYGGASWEDKANHWSSTSQSSQDYTFTTDFFMPIRLSQEEDRYRLANMSLYQPQSLTVMGQTVFVLYKKLPDKDHPEGRGFIISYDQNKIDNIGDLRKLNYYATHDYRRYKQLVKAIHVGPEIVVGHGQTLTNDGKHLYLNITKERENSKDMTGVNAINTIDPTTLAITDYNTLRSIAVYPTTKRNRRFFNMTAKDSRTFYGLCKTGDYKTTDKGKGNFELWEVQRQPDGTWTSKEALLIRLQIGDETAIQGMTYVPTQNAIYIVTDGGFVGIQLGKKPKLIANVKLNADVRESEGIAFANNRLYIGTNRGGEVLSSPLLP